MSAFSKYVVPDLEFRKKIVKMSQDNINYCYQCSNCTGICPLNMVSSFNPREIIHWGQLGLRLLPIDFERLWRCTTCAACEYVCPKEVKITEIIAANRSYGIESGEKVPASYTTTLESFFSYGNPFSLGADARTNWAKGLDVPIAKKGTEILYFVGCTASYDPRSQKIAQSLSSIFKHTKLNFGIVGNEERECGNCVYTMGETELSDHEREKNEKVIQEVQPAIIVTTSPHSYNFMKKSYSLPKNTEVYHYTQFLDQLINDGTLEFTKSLPDSNVTFHDPCYLGRHNNIYNEPRRVLEAIPGLKLAEMPNNRQLSVCCGGGGGNAWAETEVEERLSIPRLNEAIEVGASVLATACYFCLQMFDDAIKVKNREQDIQAKDIAEILAEAL
ncbi:MAG: (Fe-S)-binding protein [Candidatus Hodarchaeota archaeon]